MRVTPRLLPLLTLAACGPPDVGIPDDWATEPIPQASLQVVDTTCGPEQPSQWMTEPIFISGANPRPGEPQFALQFEGGVSHHCDAEPPVDGAYAFTCDNSYPRTHWVNTEERDCPGHALVDVSGAFTGPRSATIDFVYDVNDCPCETSCSPFPGPCVFQARMTYADPE